MPSPGLKFDFGRFLNCPEVAAAANSLLSTSYSQSETESVPMLALISSSRMGSISCTSRAARSAKETRLTISNSSSRCFVSVNKREFSSEVAAWWANVCAMTASFCVKVLGVRLSRVIYPITCPREIMGTPIHPRTFWMPPQFAKRESFSQSAMINGSYVSLMILHKILSAGKICPRALSGIRLPLAAVM